MEHDRCLELLSARLDGPLTGGEERELEDHLRTCPQCRALAEQLEQLHAGFAGLEELEAPADFTGRVMERIGGGRKVIPLFRRPQFRALAGLAACLAICVGIYGLGQGGGRDLPAGGTALLQSDGADLSVQLLEPLSAGQRRRLEEKLEAFAAFQGKKPGKFQISEM